VAVDGKTCRGARRADGTRVHLLGAAEHGGHLLDHLEVDAKHNETSHFTALLEPLDLDGVVVTFDALHTVRANLNWLAREKQARYIAVKRNQPSLYAQVKNLPWRNIPAGDRQHDRGHGREEHRTLKAATLAAGLCFPWAAQAICLTRRIRSLSGQKKWRTFTIYAVTSLTASQATPAHLAAWIRGHWHIENCSADCTYE